MDKRKKVSKHKKHKKAKQSSNSDYSSSASDEWVEQKTDASTPVSREESLSSVKPSHDGWSTNASIFSGVTRKELQESKEKKKDEKDDKKYMLDTLGQTERELNPYWKGGGSGLPSENPVAPESLRQAAVTVGDQGVAWLRRALQRATEQAAEQRRPLREVVAERWGSLEKLESMIATAEERENDRGNNRRESGGRLNQSKDRRNDREKYVSERKYDKHKSSSRREKSKDSSDEATRSGKSSKSRQEFSQERKSFAKPQDGSDDSCSSGEVQRNRHKSEKRFSKSSKNKFARPSNSSSEDERGFLKRKDSVKHERDAEKSKRNASERYRKPSSRSSSSSDTSRSEDERTRVSKSGSKKYEHSRSKESSRYSKLRHSSEGSRRSHPVSGKGWKKRTKSEDNNRITENNENQLESKKSDDENVKEIEATPVVQEIALTDKEMNDLAAKLVKAELLGNEDLAKELKAKLERARETKSSRAGQVEAREEVVILTHTDSKGFTRPVSLEAPEKSGGRRKAKKVETHSGGKRTRYFADDDKYDLQEMFTREKLSTVEDSNEVFAKLAAKTGSRQDMDDVFEETACVEESDGKKHARQRQQAISESKRVARSLDNCQWCLESKQMLKHLIVAIGNQCYLCVPPYQSLTENHCLIVPSHHSVCGTQVDEDVWAEIQEFRKCLVKMFLSQGEDVVFFENARQLNRFPHMVLNCVPVPKETGDMAPIYFKKAILECEMEWSDNKKLVDLRGRDVRRAVPKGLPYFSVDFGMDSGFAHVIENEQLFSPNFAQEIIGGMLDLDHTIWRKQRKQTFEEQSKKVIALTKLWNPYDFTKKQ